MTAARELRRYAAFASIHAVEFFAYNIWFWMNLLSQVIGMTIIVYFWRAVYADTAEIAGLGLATTLNYILIARVIGETGQTGVVWFFGRTLSNGNILLELLRPVDLQLSRYWAAAGRWLTGLISQFPVLIAALLFGLKLPTDPLAYLCFLVTFLLGATAMFCFEWAVGCLAFYTTEIWGLGIALNAVALFFSGALIPLDMFPDWLRTIAQILPYQQIVYLPASFLSGIHTPSEALPIWGGQLLSIAVWLTLSRLVFSRAVRAVTVQGG